MSTGCHLALLFVLLLATASHCKFYIYDNWPAELEDVWPPVNATLHPEAGYSHEFRGNGGAGQLIDASLGMFQTWQFAFFQLLMHRLRTSTQRSFDPREATAFIIPFDLGVHSHLDHENGRLRLASPHGWVANRLLKKAQRDRKVFWRRNGHDHYILFGITAYQMVGIGVKVFFMSVCENCTVLTIETSPTHTAIPGRGKKYWYAQPYPSFFHVTQDMTSFPWEVRPLAQRDILALFIGSVHTKTPSSNKVRRVLYKQCTSSRKCIWRKTAHTCQGVSRLHTYHLIVTFNQLDQVVNQTDAIYLFRRARYCLAPPGDSLTRKSLFDSLLAGCVPVVFIRASLTQYDWHLSREDFNKVAVYISMKDVLQNKANFITRLESIDDTELIRKQTYIATIAARLQYSVVRLPAVSKKCIT